MWDTKTEKISETPNNSDVRKYKYELDKKLFTKEFVEILKPFRKKILSIKATYIQLVAFSKDNAKPKYNYWMYISLKEISCRIPANKKTTSINLNILRELGLIFIKKNPTEADVGNDEGLKNLIDDMHYQKPNTLFLKVFPLNDSIIKNIKDKVKIVSDNYRNKYRTSEKAKVERIHRKAIEKGDLTEEELRKIKEDKRRKKAKR